MSGAEEAGASAAAHEASISKLDHALKDFSVAEIEALIERKRQKERDEFYPEQTARMRRKVEKAETALADAKAALAAALDEEQAAKEAMDAGITPAEEE